MTTLEAIRDDQSGAVYPRDLLADCRDALVLFAAGFLGKQDAFWVAEAGLAATCVDNDAEKIAEMREVYPAGWEFVAGDVFQCAAATGRTWDLVSVDCPSGAFDRCADYVSDWCRLARRFVFLGTGVRTFLAAPDGWTVADKRHRSVYDGGVYWSILEPA